MGNFNWCVFELLTFVLIIGPQLSFSSAFPCRSFQSPIVFCHSLLSSTILEIGCLAPTQFNSVFDNLLGGLGLGVGIASWGLSHFLSGMSSSHIPHVPSLPAPPTSNTTTVTPTVTTTTTASTPAPSVTSGFFHKT